MAWERRRGAAGGTAFDPLATIAFPALRPGRLESLRRHAASARARWRVVVGAAAVATLAAAVACLFLPPRYTAVATVRTTAGGAPAAGKTVSVEGLTSLAQDVAALGSRALAAEVIRTLGLERDERFLAANPGPGLLTRAARLLLRPLRSRRDAGKDVDAAPDADETADAVAADVPIELVRAYRGALRIRPVRRAGRIEVRFTSASPELAQQIANAHATEFLRRTLQARFAPTGAARALLEREATESAAESAAARTALDGFRAAHPDVTVAGPDDATRTRLVDIARRLGEAEASRISAEADDRLVKQRAYDALPAVAADPLIRTLRAEVERLRAGQADAGTPAGTESRRRDADLRQARTRLQREIGRAIGGIESALLDAQGREAGLRSQLEKQLQALDATALPAQAIHLEAAATTAETLATKLRTRMDAAGPLGSFADGTMLETAAVPTAPSEPFVALDLLLAALAGLVAGALGAAALDLLPRGLGTPDDVERLLRLPTVGVVPDFAHVVRAGAAPDVYRGLRTSVLFLDPARPPRTLLVTSAAAGDGKTATVVNLGLSLAAAGMRVVIVDAALDDPAVHRALALSPGPGLADVLRGEATLEDAIRSVPVPGGGMLRVLAGDTGDRAGELLATPRTRKVLRQLGERHDVVLIDSPAVAPLLAPLADGVLVVVPVSTAASAVRGTVERLRATRARVVGVVLNRVDPAADYYRSYAYPFAA